MRKRLVKRLPLAGHQDAAAVLWLELRNGESAGIWLLLRHPECNSAPVTDTLGALVACKMSGFAT